MRSAFADVLREQSERDFLHEVRDRYAETVRLSRSRFEAGEISEAEFRKIELEGLKYQNAVVDADTEFDLAREKLASLLGLGSAAEYPPNLYEAEPAPLSRSLPDLTEEAFRSRPDIRAVQKEKAAADSALTAAEREAYPDLTLGVTYTHSEFGVSGDNPNTLALGASLPLPLFDCNQANVGRAGVGVHRAVNDAARLELQVRHEVADAVRRFERAESLLGLFRSGGMLERAETSLKVAEKSYKAGAVSLIELLEAQRTYLETRDEYLSAEYDHQQSAIDFDACDWKETRMKATIRTRTSKSWPCLLVSTWCVFASACSAKVEPAAVAEASHDSIRLDPGSAHLNFVKIDTVELSDAAPSVRLTGKVGFDEDHTAARRVAHRRTRDENPGGTR